VSYVHLYQNNNNITNKNTPWQKWKINKDRAEWWNTHKNRKETSVQIDKMVSVRYSVEVHMVWLPGPHSTQYSCPGVGWCRPRRHGIHVVCLVAFCEVPTGHFSQCTAPTLSENCPSGHGSHSSARGMSEWERVRKRERVCVWVWVCVCECVCVKECARECVRGSVWECVWEWVISFSVGLLFNIRHHHHLSVFLLDSSYTWTRPMRIYAYMRACIYIYISAKNYLINT